MTEFVFNILSNLNSFININYFYSLLLYLTISILFFTLSLPGGMIILLGSGFFFGFINGFLINIFSISFGSLIFILFSKTLLNKLFNKYYIKYSKKLSIYINKSSYEYLILIRLILGLPLVFQNVSISLLDVSIKKILFSSIIGFTPLMIIFAYSGSYLSSIFELKEFTFSKIFSLELILILVCMILLILIRIFFKKNKYFI